MRFFYFGMLAISCAMLFNAVTGWNASAYAKRQIARENQQRVDLHARNVCLICKVQQLERQVADLQKRHDEAEKKWRQVTINQNQIAMELYRQHQRILVERTRVSKLAFDTEQRMDQIEQRIDDVIVDCGDGACCCKIDRAPPHCAARPAAPSNNAARYQRRGCRRRIFRRR